MPLAVGDPAPNFTAPLVGTDGTFTLADYAGEVVLLAFNGLTWCPPCQFEAPILQDLWEEFQSSVCYVPKPRFLMISVADELRALTAAIADVGITFPVVPPASSVPGLYEVVSVPTVYVVGPDQKICAVKIGAGPPEDALRNELRSLLLTCGVRHAPWCIDPSKWGAVAGILIGVTQDQGGIVIVGGKPRPVPPWDPLRRDALLSLAISELATEISELRSRTAIQRGALDLLETTVQRMRARASRLPGSFEKDRLPVPKGKRKSG
jgi:peroxiredoxin